ncbi:hypothetical protein Adt_06233 [Abeliophyllum distichum]|uniref:Uncharacterized protein n=1 Tax=Abeliophyllum distichum TaxID=126358 RepID=A0ABD1V6K5_9LAMI
MPHSFEELATRTHDLEIQIARYESYLPSDLRDKKDPKKETRGMVSQLPSEEVFCVKGSYCLLRQKKIKLEIGENPTVSCSMVSFDPIFIPNKKHTFPTLYGAGKFSFEVTEFGLQLQKGSIPVELKKDKKVTIKYVYPKMVKPDSGNRPTFYKIMTDDLDVWDFDSKSEDEIGDG